MLGDVSRVRKIGGRISTTELTDPEIEAYLDSATDWLENGTGISEADWPTAGDYNLALLAVNNYAAAWCVLTVSTVKDATERHKELLGSANAILAQIVTGATEDEEEEGVGFINENSNYMTYENNPIDVDPYMSFH